MQRMIGSSGMLVMSLLLLKLNFLRIFPRIM